MARRGGGKGQSDPAHHRSLCGTSWCLGLLRHSLSVGRHRYRGFKGSTEADPRHASGAGQGGGGGVGNPVNNRPGGSGGGGTGNFGPGAGQAGQANTGGGAGASGDAGSSDASGGSGVVIFRAPSATTLTVSPGTNQTSTAPGGEKIATFIVFIVLNLSGKALTIYFITMS